MPYRYSQALSDGIRPDPVITYTEWANQKFHLPKESSSEYGRYRSSRTPFVEDVLDELSPTSKTQIVVVIKPTQCGATTVALIFLCGCADLYPGPCMLMQPTDSMVKSFSKKRLATSVKLVPSLRDKIRDPKSRDSGNTILQKDFPGGSWLLTGSNSGASYRSESIKNLIIDDFDAFESDIEDEGSPEELADRRTGTFPGRKVYINSTTTTKGKSNIERAFEPSSQGYFNVPCPHCGFYQYLEWGTPTSDYGIKFERDKNGLVSDVFYQCVCCRQRIDDHDKPWMLENGKYVHKYPERKVRGFKWNGLHTPLGWINSWTYITEKFLEAKADLKKGNVEKYKTWLNTFMSEAWEEKGDRSGAEIRALADDRPTGRVPSEGVLGLTAGIDTQDNGFYYVIRAWGADFESWLIDYGFVDTFDLVDRVVLKSAYKDGQGNEYPVLYSLQDAMGHRTAEVYDFVRVRDGIMAAQGVGVMKTKTTVSNIDTYPGTNKPIPGGVKMLRVNTLYFKNYLSNKLKVNPKNPGAYHMHSEIATKTGRAYIDHMTAEFINKKDMWECPANKPNHYWDCECLALCAADYIGVTNYAEPQIINNPKPAIQSQEPTSNGSKHTGGRIINPWKRR